MITMQDTSDVNGPFAEQRDAFAGRLFESILGVMDIATVYLGDRLGLYQALSGSPASAPELATRTGLDARYVREWLEQQAISGVLEVDDAAAGSETRRYSLPGAHAEVLLDRDSLSFFAPMTRMLIASTAALPAIERSFREGGGVAYADYGADMHEGLASANRPMFLHLLGRDWLPAIPDVHDRLHADPPAKVADIGCGHGWSSLAIARAYPSARVDGFDLDVSSIARARHNAEAEGLADRVQFHVRDASDPAFAGQYDLVTAFECIHDMSRPVEALRAMRGMAGSDGVVLVVDERTAETFALPGDAMERFMYGISVLHCLPVGMAEQPSVGTGTVMRSDTFRGYAIAAGFTDVEILPIENDFWRFYRLVN